MARHAGMLGAVSGDLHRHMGDSERDHHGDRAMSTSEILKLAEEKIDLIMEVNRLRAALQRIKFMNIKPDQKCCEDAADIAREALKR
jgi:hypothetical protein